MVFYVVFDWIISLELWEIIVMAYFNLKLFILTAAITKKSPSNLCFRSYLPSVIEMNRKTISIADYSELVVKKMMVKLANSFMFKFKMDWWMLALLA